MGYFTWTDCQNRRKKIKYGERAYIICPDDTIIEESCYDGYGMFGRYDVYDLVVDWNRKFLKEIFEKKEAEYGSNGYFGYELKDIAIAAMDGDDKAQALIRANSDKYPNYMQQEWKRNIGITIACEDKDNDSLPFPIKISMNKPRKKDCVQLGYKDFKPSQSTQ